MARSTSLIDQIIAQDSVFDSPEPSGATPVHSMPESLGVPLGKPEELPAAQPDKKPDAPAPVKAPTPEGGAKNIQEIVLNAAKKHGVDPTRLLALAYHETGGTLDPTLVNKKSGAKGLFQALPAWAKDYGVTGKEFDPEAVADAAARSLKGSSGVKNHYVAYLIHNQGRKGAEQILRAAAGEAPLPSARRATMLAQPGFKDRRDAVSDEELAKAFIAQQKKHFMKHYNRATKVAGEKARDSQIVSRGSGGLDWDSLIQSATAGIAGQAANTALAMTSGPSMDRTQWGGKK